MSSFELNKIIFFLKKNNIKYNITRCSDLIDIFIKKRKNFKIKTKNDIAIVLHRKINNKRIYTLEFFNTKTKNLVDFYSTCNIIFLIRKLYKIL